MRVAHAIRSFRPDAVIVQGAQDTALALAGRRLARGRRPGRPRRARRLARRHARVTARRARRLLSPAVDRLADYAVRHADGVRTVSGFTTASCASGASSRPRRSRPTWISRRSSRRRRCRFPRRRARSSSASSSATRRSTCWRTPGARVSPRVPDAELQLVGVGPLRAARRGARGRAASCASAGRPGSRRRRWRSALDEATLLVLPSRRRGDGPGDRRGVLPRPRPSSEPTRAGSPISSSDEVSGCSCRRTTPPRSPPRSSECSTDRELATRLGAGAHAASPRLVGDPRGVRGPHAGSRRPRRRAEPARDVAPVFVTQRVDPGGSRSRRHGREDRGAGGALRRGRRLHRQRRSGVAARQLQRAHLRRARRGSAAGCGSGTRSSPSSPRRPRPVAVLAHMCPIYAVLAAPLARPLGVRVLLWYAQWHRTRMLELAARLSTAVVSVDRSTIPIPSSRAVGIGHGIDMSPLRLRLRHRGRAAVRGSSRSGATRSRRASPTIVRAVAIARDARASTCGSAATARRDRRGRRGDARRPRPARRRARSR